MSVHLEIKKEYISSNEAKELKLQYLPATIDGDGPASVKQYFSQFTKESNGVLTNSLRGYPLTGCNFDVPSSCKGIVFQETQKPLDEVADRKFKATGKFSNFIYWNYDKIPSKNDPLNQALDIIDLADTVSETVSMEEIENELENKTCVLKIE